MIRSYLEGLCARWACEKMSTEGLKELEEVVDLTDYFITKGNTEQIVELDNRFHEILYRTSESKWLNHMLSDFHHYVQRVRMISLGDVSRAQKSNQEHRSIVEAIRSGDKEEAERLAHEHIIQTISNLNRRGL